MSPTDDPLAPLADETGPVFDEPWHAQVLALADTMVQAGHFSASDWANALGAARRRAHDGNAPDTTETYYLCAVEALETLVAGSTPISGDAMLERKEAWARAYLATPHGKPVDLGTGEK